MAEFLRAESGRPDTVKVIPNWALTEPSPEDVTLAKVMRDEWALSGRFVVGYSGNMGRGHEFETIMSAISALRENARIVFLFVGDGARRPWLEERVANAGLRNVVFKPYQHLDRLSASLCVPDVHLISLLPIMEGLIVPSKFYGVVAMGKPVLFVGDRQGELSRQIQEAGNGRGFCVGDSVGLAATIEMLSSDEGVREQWGASSSKLHLSICHRDNRLISWKDLVTDIVER